MESTRLPSTDTATNLALALTPPVIRSAYAQLAAGDGTSVIPLHRSSFSTCHTSRGTYWIGPDRASADCDEDTVSAAPSTQSFLAEQFFVAATTRACDLVELEHTPHFRSLLQCLQMRGSNYWLLAVPIPGLQQTLDGLHYCTLLRYCLGMQMFPEQDSCPCCQDPMDIFDDHALLCRQQPTSAGFQLCHRLVQHTLGTLLRQAGICHSVEPDHLRFSREEAPASGRGSGLTKPADILLYAWRGDHHCCVDLVGVSPARNGWRDATSVLSVVEQGKRDKHADVCRSHGFDFVPFGFSVFGSFGPEAQELLDRVVQRYRLHAQVADWEAHAWIFRRLSFTIMRSVAEQFVGRMSDTFGW